MSDPEQGRTGRNETDDERHDRQLNELLQELRVALPGVQVLFAFLLTVPFSARFDDTTDLQRDVYFGTLLMTAVATILLMAPSAIHRLLFHRGVKGEIVEMGHRLTIAGLTALALAIAGAVFLVADVLFDTTSAVVVGVLVLFAFALVWALLPLSRQARRRRG